MSYSLIDLSENAQDNRYPITNDFGLLYGKTQLSDDEFKRVLNHLDKGNVFDRAERIRDNMLLTCDDNTSFHIAIRNEL